MSSSHLERIETLLHSKTAANEPDFKSALARLSAEVKERLKQDSPNSVEYFSGVVRALSRLKGTTHADARMNCLFDSGAYLFSNGYGPQALVAARELDELAHRADLKPWIRKAGNLSGVVNADLGNVAEALITYSNSLSLAREMGDIHGEISVLTNLGVALNQGGLCREAIPCLESAVSLSKTDAAPASCASVGMSVDDFVLPVLSNLAQSHLFLEQFHQGFAAISECLRRSQEPHDAGTATGRGIREFTYVQLALELGKFDLAREHSALGIRYGRLGWKRGLYSAEVARGLCEVYCGDADLGIAIL